MKLNAVAVSAKNIEESIKFYKLLGFKFSSFKDSDQHVESVPKNGIKLMIDSEELMESILGEMPKPANHSSFAIEFDSPSDVNKTVKELEENNYPIYKQPWDAFWGQRYSIVKDPEGYLIDLYSQLK